MAYFGPASQVTLASAVASRSAAGSAASAAPAVTGLDLFSSAVLVLTTSVIGVGGTSLQLIVQGSYDNGTSWFDVGSFGVLIPADALGNQQIMRLSAGNTAATVPAKALAGTLAAGTVVQGEWGNALRLFEVVVGTYAPPPTYTVQGYFRV